MRHCGLADGQIVVDGRQHDVGNDALQLGGRSVWQIKFLDGELGGPGLDGTAHELAHLDNGLDTAFAVGGTVADDDGPAVILQRTSHDFRSGGAKAVDEHGERAIISELRIVVRIDVDVAFVVLDLHDRAFADEKTGEIDGLREQAPAVVPQIEDDTSDPRLLELNQQVGDVLGRAGFLSALIPVFVGAVKGREGDDSQRGQLALGIGDCEDRRMGASRVELYDVAGEHDGFARG